MELEINWLADRNSTLNENSNGLLTGLCENRHPKKGTFCKPLEPAKKQRRRTIQKSFTHMHTINARIFEQAKSPNLNFARPSQHLWSSLNKIVPPISKTNMSKSPRLSTQQRARSMDNSSGNSINTPATLRCWHNHIKNFVHKKHPCWMIRVKCCCVYVDSVLACVSLLLAKSAQCI